MTVDEILAEVEKLPAEEKMHLVETLGKRASCAAMGEFWVLHRAMRECMGTTPGVVLDAARQCLKEAASEKEARHG